MCWLSILVLQVTAINVMSSSSDGITLKLCRGPGLFGSSLRSGEDAEGCVTELRSSFERVKEYLNSHECMDINQAMEVVGVMDSLISGSSYLQRLFTLAQERALSDLGSKSLVSNALGAIEELLPTMAASPIFHERLTQARALFGQIMQRGIRLDNPDELKIYQADRAALFMAVRAQALLGISDPSPFVPEPYESRWETRDDTTVVRHIWTTLETQLLAATHVHRNMKQILQPLEGSVLWSLKDVVEALSAISKSFLGVEMTIDALLSSSNPYLFTVTATRSGAVIGRMHVDANPENAQASMTCLQCYASDGEANAVVVYLAQARAAEGTITSASDIALPSIAMNQLFQYAGQVLSCFLQNEAFPSAVLPEFPQMGHVVMSTLFELFGRDWRDAAKRHARFLSDEMDDASFSYSFDLFDYVREIVACANGVAYMAKLPYGPEGIARVLGISEENPLFKMFTAELPAPIAHDHPLHYRISGLAFVSMIHSMRGYRNKIHEIYRAVANGDVISQSVHEDGLLKFYTTGSARLVDSLIVGIVPELHEQHKYRSKSVQEVVDFAYLMDELKRS